MAVMGLQLVAHIGNKLSRCGRRGLCLLMVITMCSVVKQPSHRGVVCNTVCEAKAFPFTQVAQLHIYCYLLSISLHYSLPSPVLFILYILFSCNLVHFSFRFSTTRLTLDLPILVLLSLSHFSLSLFPFITHFAYTCPSIHTPNLLKSKYQQQKYVPIWFRCQQHTLGLWVGSLRLFAVLGQQWTLLVHHAHIGTV